MYNVSLPFDTQFISKATYHERGMPRMSRVCKPELMSLLSREQDANFTFAPALLVL